MARSLIDMVTLDLHIEEQLAKHSNLRGFKVVLWRQETDIEGCNWNARVERVGSDGSSDTTWWDVVPKMRERFNLL